MRDILDKFIRYGIENTRLKKLLMRDNRTKSAVELLYPKQQCEDILTEIWVKRVKTIVILLFVVVNAFIYCKAQTKYFDFVDGENSVVLETDESIGFNFSVNMDGEIVSDHMTIDPRTETHGTETGNSDENQRKDEILYEMRDEIESAVESQRGNKVAVLPKEVSGRDVRYFNDKPETDYSLFALSLVILILCPVIWYKKQRERVEERENQLILDYPTFVNKMSIFLGAGLTVRGAVERLCMEYRERKEKGGNKRYLYEELLIVNSEISNGISEGRAIEKFGKRCRLVSYMRFASILSQCIKKGSDNVTEMLDEEVRNSMEIRRENAKARGERASTKLLLPCVLMLGIVMAIIMIPAFLTM